MQRLGPPAHRGPLVASGLVVLAVGLLLVEVRLDEELSRGAHVGLLLGGAVLAGWLAAAAPNEGGRPPAYRSVELVVCVGLFGLALLRIPETLSAGWMTALAAVFAALSLSAAIRARSAVCVLLAAMAWVIAGLAGATWLIDAGGLTYRFLLTGAAATLVLVALWLRAGWPRCSILLIDAAGLCVLGIAATLVAPVGPFFFGAIVGDSAVTWEGLLLACGCGLVAFGAVEGEPTPAGLGIAVLASFVALAGLGGDGWLWWPVVLLVIGGGVVLAALRPASPLPPEPGSDEPDAQVRPFPRS